MGTIIISVILFCLFGAAMSYAEKENWPMFWLFLSICFIGLLNSPL